MFTRFDRTHERDRQTDTQTDGRTSHDGKGRCMTAKAALDASIARQK